MPTTGVPGHLGFRGMGSVRMDPQTPRVPQDSQLRAHLDAPAARTLLALPGSGGQGPGAQQLRPRSPEGGGESSSAPTPPPPGPARPARPAASRPRARSQPGAGGARRDGPRLGGITAAPHPALNAHDRPGRAPRTHRPWFGVPRGRAEAGWRRGGDRRPESGGGGGEEEEEEGPRRKRRRRLQTSSSGSSQCTRSASREPPRRGLYRRPPGPRPFLPIPPRPAPPSRRLLCVPAGRRVPAPARRDAPTLGAASRIWPPRGHRRVTVPRKRQEARRPRGAAPAWAELSCTWVARSGCRWEEAGPPGSRRVPGTLGEWS